MASIPSKRLAPAFRASLGLERHTCLPSNLDAPVYQNAAEYVVVEIIHIRSNCAQALRSAAGSVALRKRDSKMGTLSLCPP
jgi:hypothetical protein